MMEGTPFACRWPGPAGPRRVGVVRRQCACGTRARGSACTLEGHFEVLGGLEPDGSQVASGSGDARCALGRGHGGLRTPKGTPTCCRCGPAGHPGDTTSHGAGGGEVLDGTSPLHGRPRNREHRSCETPPLSAGKKPLSTPLLCIVRSKKVMTLSPGRIRPARFNLRKTGQAISICNAIFDFFQSPPRALKAPAPGMLPGLLQPSLRGPLGACYGAKYNHFFNLSGQRTLRRKSPWEAMAGAPPQDDVRSPRRASRCGSASSFFFFLLIFSSHGDGRPSSSDTPRLGHISAAQGKTSEHKPPAPQLPARPSLPAFSARDVPGCSWKRGAMVLGNASPERPFSPYPTPARTAGGD